MIRQGVHRQWPAMSVLLLITSLMAGPVTALDPKRDVDQYIHEVWTSQDGLPQNSINGLTLGPRGYLWLATYDGLIRFDGERFHRLEDERLPGRRLRIIGAHSHGFWVSGELRGLVFFDGEKAHPIANHDNEMRWPLSAAIGDENRAWIAANNGLFRLQGESLEAVENGLPEGSAMMSLARFGPRQRLAVAGLDGVFLEQSDGRFQPLSVGEAAGMHVYSLVGEKDGLWIGGDRGLFHLRLNEAGDQRLESTEWHWSDRDGYSIRALHRDTQGNLWAGIQGLGVGRVNAGGHQLFTRDDGLSHHSISAFFQDPEGSLWIGTDGGGLNRLRDGSVIAHGGDGSPLDHSILPMVADSRGDLWLGGVCSGVHRFRDGEVIERFNENHGLANSCIYSLLLDDQNRLWAGSYGGGVFRRDGEQDFRQIALAAAAGSSEDQADDIVVTALHQGPDGSIWLGSNQGLFRYHADNDQFRRLEGSETHFIVQIRLEDDRLLLATNEGAYQAPVPDGDGPLQASPISDDPRLRGARVREIHRDDAGIWMGTYGAGLQFFDGEALHVLDQRHGLKESVISRILRDDREGLIMSGNRGISRVSRSELLEVIRGERSRADVQLLGTRDGMRVAETNGGGQPAGLRDAQGRYWFPTVDGIVQLGGEEDTLKLRPPPVHIESVRVGGEPVPVDDTVTIPADRRELEVRYTGLSFIAPERMRFRYRLGETSPWVDVGNRRSLLLAHPPAGEYTLEILAANEDGIWSEQTARLALQVKAPFRKTIWFPLLLVTAAMIGLGGLSALGLYRARSRRRQLERLVEERTAALEQANAQLSTQASRDGLTGAGNRRQLRDRLTSNWRDCAERGQPLSLLILDIDHFKEYNDAHGHLTGDHCLCQIVDALQGLLRPQDTLVRFGGEEFVILLPGVDGTEATTIAERLRRRVSDLGIPHRASPVARCVTLSIGRASVHPGADERSNELLRKADQALYQAKEKGRNRVWQSAVRDDQTPT